MGEQHPFSPKFCPNLSIQVMSHLDLQSLDLFLHLFHPESHRPGHQKGHQLLRCAAVKNGENVHIFVDTKPPTELTPWSRKSTPQRSCLPKLLHCTRVGKFANELKVVVFFVLTISDNLQIQSDPCDHTRLWSILTNRPRGCWLMVSYSSFLSWNRHVVRQLLTEILPESDDFAPISPSSTAQLELVSQLETFCSSLIIQFLHHFSWGWPGWPWKIGPWFQQPDCPTSTLVPYDCLTVPQSCYHHLFSVYIR